MEYDMNRTLVFDALRDTAIIERQCNYRTTVFCSKRKDVDQPHGFSADGIDHQRLPDLFESGGKWFGVRAIEA
jgi:hypothetical protein